MERSYRSLKHWDHWLAQEYLGKRLLEAEGQSIAGLIHQHFGKHALLIGVPQQYGLLKSTAMPRLSLLTPIHHQENGVSVIGGDFHDLPLLTGSLDIVILPHTLELIDNPRQLLSEACRVIKPEGLIVICGFNPFSPWGIKKFFTNQHKAPWTGSFISPAKIKKWLELADFKLENQTAALFSPPVTSPAIFDKFQFLEKIGGQWCSILGGTYILVARAKVIPLTPIKLKWKQQLSGLRLPTTISGHIARSSEK